MPLVSSPDAGSVVAAGGGTVDGALDDDHPAVGDHIRWRVSSRKRGEPRLHKSTRGGSSSSGWNAAMAMLGTRPLKACITVFSKWQCALQSGSPPFGLTQSIAMRSVTPFIRSPRF